MMMKPQPTYTLNQAPRQCNQPTHPPTNQPPQPGNTQPLREISAHRESVRAVSVGPTDLKFATASDDGAVKVWDMYSCEAEATLTGEGVGVGWGGGACCVGVEGGVACPAPAVYLLEPPGNATTDYLPPTTNQPNPGHGGDVRHCHWHPASSLIASASKDASVKLWDSRSGGEALATLHGHKGAVMQVGRQL
jgi:polyadenylation factor subunit 2